MMFFVVADDVVVAIFITGVAIVIIIVVVMSTASSFTAEGVSHRPSRCQVLTSLPTLHPQLECPSPLHTPTLYLTFAAMFFCLSTTSLTLFISSLHFAYVCSPVCLPILSLFLSLYFSSAISAFYIVYPYIQSFFRFLQNGPNFSFTFQLFLVQQIPCFSFLPENFSDYMYFLRRKEL